MIEFKALTLEDKNKIQSYTLQSGRQNCDLTFANLYSWRFLYQTVWAEVENFLVFRFMTEGAPAYMLPIGNGNLKPVIEELIQDAKNDQHAFRMLGICADAVPEIERLFPDTFAFSSDRTYADYIYSRTDLATLKGKAFQPKRNHINRFKNIYEYRYLPLTAELIPECLELEAKWFSAHTEHELKALSAEQKSLTCALKNFEHLDILGGVLCVNGQIGAFTFGAPITNNTFDVCVEKADINIEGVYPMINHLFVNTLPENFIYINREEDLGLEGLRRSKESYQPILLLEKFVAELK